LQWYREGAEVPSRPRRAFGERNEIAGDVAVVAQGHGADAWVKQFAK
jgi:hypothetical protein